MISPATSDEYMVTPSTSATSQERVVNHKRKASRSSEAELSASPILKDKRSGVNKMHRTPQPTLTQSKLTGFTGRPEKQALPSEPMETGATTVGDSSAGKSPTGDQNGATNRPGMACAAGNNGHEPPATSSTAQGPSPFITTDFLLKALKENTDQIVKLFTSNIGDLAQKVEDNASRTLDNSAAIARHDTNIEEHGSALASLTSRVAALEKGNTAGCALPMSRAPLSREFTIARRSVRLWPVPGITEQDMWGNVGEFLHDVLKVPESELGQEDIELVNRVRNDALQDRVRDEVCIRFVDKRKRDVVFSYANSLADKFDSDGRPTAGIRLEIPEELMDTFRLLARFGTWLRARHGNGTKRHIKFDDFSGSLYANIKLPGDMTWTKVTPAMAREDLEASHREENARHQRRLATKLVPGPRERLREQMPIVNVTAGPGGFTVVGEPPAGKRPRWTGPDRSRQGAL